jgi:hypothetical protein
MTANSAFSWLVHSFDSIHDFRPSPGSVYVSCRSVEERSAHVESWGSEANQVQLVDIVREERESIWWRANGGEAAQVALRSARKLREFWRNFGDARVYLDMTGMRHSSWASLIRGIAGESRELRVIYVEPDEYSISPNPTDSEFYDLSVKIEGIAPLPGFARLREEGPTSCFIPLLGFEGTRLLFLISELEPPGQRIFPVVGVPGFRAEYPFVTYLSNRAALRETQAWKKVRFAPADSPFEVYSVLAQLQQEHPGEVLKIAPIGTKPHALGAVLYALKNPAFVELVYDHPVRKDRRTVGSAKLHMYSISASELQPGDA